MGGISVATLPRLSIITMPGLLRLPNVLLVELRGIREEPRPTDNMLGGVWVSVLPGDIGVSLLGVHRLPALLTMELCGLREGHAAPPPLLSDGMLRRISVVSSLAGAKSLAVCRGSLLGIPSTAGTSAGSVTPSLTSWCRKGNLAVTKSKEMAAAVHQAP